MPVVQAPVIHESDDYSIASGLDSSASPCDTKSEIKIDDTNDVSDGLSMMAQEVQCDGTIANVKGQHSSIFMSECSIKDKVCKLIIDGGSFTNVVSSDVVQALSLSAWRLPMPRYMQWMNQSGMLKITHRARVKFSMGNYVDSVDCNVVPMNACHLLLGRPWQFDLDATHGGRSNTYSFIHKGVHHILKPMKKSDIKAHVFAGATRKKSGVYTTSKSRTTLIQGEGNDVALSSEIIACESSSKGLNSMVASARTFDDISNDVTDKAQLVNTEIHDPPMQIASAADALKVGERENLSLVMSSKYPFENETLMDHDSVPILASKSSEVVDFNSKPRTALFQGSEDDEPMAPQIIHACKSGIISNMITGVPLDLSRLKFGAIHFVEKYSNSMAKFTSMGLSSNIIFRGATFKGEEIMKPKKIYRGWFQAGRHHLSY